MKSKLLSELRQSLKQEAAPPPPKARPTPKPTAVEETLSDAELFARATNGARRMEHDGVADSGPAKPDQRALARRAAALGSPDTPTEALSDTAALLNPLAPEAVLEFARSGIQTKVIKHLKQGQPPWQAAVDLHGCSLEQARDAVDQLIAEARRNNLQVVKIVHGKGSRSEQPLLKSCVNGWLQQISGVLAFVSALPRDGGTGAVYVLLKRTPVVLKAKD